MSTQYDILRYLQERGEMDTAALYEKFGVATGKKLRLLKRAGMIVQEQNIIRLARGVTEEQILSKKPKIV